VLRIYDPCSGQPEPVRPARPGQLHTYLAAPAPAGPAPAEQVQPGDLRSALLADLVRRVAERHHLLVTAWQTPGTAAMRAACGALNIHPAQPSPHPPDPLDVGIAPPAGAFHAGAARTHWLRPAAVGFEGGGGPAPGSPGALPAGLTDRGLDPLALRLVFLREDYRDPVTLRWDTLGAADQALRGWREQAAGWANSPSKPMSARYVGDVNAAFDDDLGTPAALRTLQALADDAEIPPGSKFEAFAYLDLLLGLDLARDVGR